MTDDNCNTWTRADRPWLSIRARREQITRPILDHPATLGSTPYRFGYSEVSCSDPLSYGRTFVLKESTNLDFAF
jgi:hypothetical protein